MGHTVLYMFKTVTTLKTLKSCFFDVGEKTVFWEPLPANQHQRWGFSSGLSDVEDLALQLQKLRLREQALHFPGHQLLQAQPQVGVHWSRCGRGRVLRRTPYAVCGVGCAIRTLPRPPRAWDLGRVLGGWHCFLANCLSRDIKWWYILQIHVKEFFIIVECTQDFSFQHKRATKRWAVVSALVCCSKVTNLVHLRP